MPRLDLRTRESVVLLKEKGYTYKEIKERLKEVDIDISIKSLYLLVKKYALTQSVIDRRRRSVPKMLTAEHYRIIDEAMCANDELTTRKLRELLTEKYPGLVISLSTVKRARRELGWVISTPKYCQLIRQRNEEKTLEWCKKMKEEGETFDDVIFTDESTIALESHRKRCYRRKRQPRKLKPRPKHPLKVHVWGGISKRGATNLIIFSGTLIATKYTKILDAGLLPFTQAVFSDGYRLQQDNDPKHCANYTKNYFAEKNVNWWPTPPESPDLNPIENMWGTMKEFLRNECKPRNLDELKAGIRTFWKTVTAAKCEKYINHLQKVIPVVIQKNGGPSGY